MTRAMRGGRPLAWRGGALALVGVLALSSLGCGRPATTATEAVVQFYTMLDAAGIRRVPDEVQLRALRPLLADSLAGALLGAHRAREASARSSPGEKPPFADGDVFTSLFEGPSSSVVVDSIARGDTTLVVMKFTNDSQKPPVDWKDTVIVVKHPDGFRIADVRYGGDWEFGMRGRLLDILRTR